MDGATVLIVVNVTLNTLQAMFLAWIAAAYGRNGGPATQIPPLAATAPAKGRLRGGRSDG